MRSRTSASLLWVGMLALLITACGRSVQPTQQPVAAPQDVSLLSPAVPPTIPAGSSEAGIRLTLQTNTKVWLRVIADGEQVFEGQLEEGVEKTWSARERLVLKTSNAGGVQVSVNGQPFIKLGPFGKVREREYRVEGNQVKFVDTK